MTEPAAEARWAEVGAAFVKLADDDPYWAEFHEWESLGDPATTGRWQPHGDGSER